MVALSQCGRHRTPLVFDVHDQPLRDGADSLVHVEPDGR